MPPPLRFDPRERKPFASCEHQNFLKCLPGIHQPSCYQHRRLPPGYPSAPAPTLIGCELLKSAPSRTVTRETPAKRRDYTPKASSVNNLSCAPPAVRRTIGSLQRRWRRPRRGLVLAHDASAPAAPATLHCSRYNTATAAPTPVAADRFADSHSHAVAHPEEPPRPPPSAGAMARPARRRRAHSPHREALAVLPWHARRRHRRLSRGGRRPGTWFPSAAPKEWSPRAFALTRGAGGLDRRRARRHRSGASRRHPGHASKPIFARATTRAIAWSAGNVPDSADVRADLAHRLRPREGQFAADHRRGRPAAAR